jgi:hypothetical protein
VCRANRGVLPQPGPQKHRSKDRLLGLGRFHCAGSLRSRGAARERQKSDVAGALDGYTKPALVTRANACHAARQNFAALLHELGKDVGTLVIDKVHLLDAELADFLFAEVLTLSATWSARTTWATGAAFTASAATAGATFATSTRGVATRTVSTFATRTAALATLSTMTALASLPALSAR